MKFCANCGSELLENGSCPSCDLGSQTTLIYQEESATKWIESMFRMFMIAFAASAFMFFLTWPIILVTDSSVLNPGTNIYFLSLALSFIITIALSVLLRGRLALFAGLFFSGLLLWVLPGFLEYLFYQLGQDVPFPTYLGSIGTVDDLFMTLSSNPMNYFGGAFGWIVTLGFYLMSLAHLPMVAVGVIVIGQEAISQNLKDRAKPSTETGSDGALVVGAFIAAFLVPVAGLVLSLIALPKWSGLSQRNRGLVIAALAISALNFVFSILFGLFFATTLIPAITGFIEDLAFYL